jgi:hypothetical protein
MSLTLEVYGSVSERLLAISSVQCITDGKQFNVFWPLKLIDGVDSLFTDIFQIPSNITLISSKEADKLKGDAISVIKTDQVASVNYTSRVYIIANNALAHEKVTSRKMSDFLSSLKYTLFIKNLIESATLSIFKNKVQSFVSVALPDIISDKKAQHYRSIEKYIAEMRLLLLENPKTLFLVHSTKTNYTIVFNETFQQKVTFVPKYFCTMSQQEIINIALMKKTPLVLVSLHDDAFSKVLMYCRVNMKTIDIADFDSSNIELSSLSTDKIAVGNDVLRFVDKNDKNLMNIDAKTGSVQVINDITVDGTSVRNTLSDYTLFKSNLTNPTNTTLDTCLTCIKHYHDAIYNANTLIDIMKKNTRTIQTYSNYMSVLQPIVQNIFLDETKAYSTILGLNPTNAMESKVYFQWKKNSQWSGKTISKILQSEQIDSVLTSQVTHCIDILKSKNPTSTSDSFYYIDITVDSTATSIHLNIYFFSQDILETSDWIVTLGYLDLSPILPSNLFAGASVEYRLQRISVFNEQINAFLAGTLFNDRLDVWQLGDPQNFEVLKCISSKTYPQWNGMYIKDCVIPQSTSNISDIVMKIESELFYNYPQLYPGQFAIVIYSIANDYCFAYIKVIVDPTDSSKLAISFVPLNFEEFYSQLFYFNMKTDISLQGQLKVLTHDNQVIMKTDCTKKVTVFNDHVGINKQISDVSALLDIDNVSNSMLLSIIQKLEPMCSNSYDCALPLKNLLQNTQLPSVFDNITLFSQDATLKSFIESIIVFCAPLQNIIKPSDVNFLYSYDSQGPFGSKAIDATSFSRISLIVNELNKMKETPDIDLTTSIFSFVEILNDTKFYYLCSIRSFVIGGIVYFSMFVEDINSFMISPSYQKTLTSLFDAISGTHRFVNYLSLVIQIPEIQTKLLQGDSVNSITKYINDSQYFRNRFNVPDSAVFCSTGPAIDASKTYNEMLFNEKHTEWNLKNIDKIFIRNTDVKVGDIQNLVVDQFYSKYGSNSTEQTFLVSYSFDRHERISSVQKITIAGVTHLLGCGIDLVDYLDKSIISTGDVISSGQFTIRDENDKDIFKVDTVNKTISNLYQVGVGKSNPSATLDVHDSGIQDVMNMIDSLAKEMHNLNRNMNTLRACQSEAEVCSVVPNQFLNYTVFPCKPINQTIDSYFFINKLDTEYVEKSRVNYHWLFPHWGNHQYENITDPNNQLSVDQAIRGCASFTHDSLLYNNSLSLSTHDWVFGKKIVLIRSVKAADNNLYTIGTGINIQSYNLRYNTNKNIDTFCKAVQTYSLYFQYIIASASNLDVNSLPNFVTVQNFLNSQSKQFPIENGKCMQVVVDYTNYYNSVITPVTYDSTNNIIVYYPEKSGSLLNEASDYTTRFKYLNFIMKMSSGYQDATNTSNTLSSLYPQPGDYGVLAFEDNHLDYYGQFFVTAQNTFLVLDFPIQSIIYPALDTYGDVRVKGDLIVKDMSTVVSSMNNYFSVDPTLKFVGINTDQRYINYNSLFAYSTSTSIYNSKHHVYITNNTNPTIVFERIGEKAGEIKKTYPISNPPTEAEILDIQHDTSNNYNNFRSFSAATIRRKSYNYTYEEMYKYTFGNAALYKNNAKFGVEIACELTDKNDFTTFMGNFGMVIDSLDKNGKVQSAFVVRAYDVSDQNVYFPPRQIMYVDHKSTLTVGNIVVGKMSPDQVSPLTGPSNIKVDSVTLKSNYDMYVTTDTDSNGNIIETLWWGNNQISAQMVTPQLVQQSNDRKNKI